MIDWPWGKRAAFDEHGLDEILDDDTPVQWWLCRRLDQPWTWRSMSNQQVGKCVDCGVALVYRASAKSPPPETPKICTACLTERLGAEA